MTRHPLLTLLAVVVIVGTLVYGVIRSRFGTPAAPETQAQAMAVQATMEPQEPTAVPSPTLDYYATQVIQQTGLTNAQAELARVNLQIEQTNLQIQQSKEREAQALASIAASESEKSANNLRITEAQNERTRLEIELKELEIQREHVENERAAILTRQKEAENQARMGWFVPAGWLLVTGAAIYLGRQIGKGRAEQYAQVEQDEPDTQPPAGYQPVQVNISPREVHQFDIQIASAEKAILRRAAVELGGRFSRPTMTPRYFSDPRWREIDDILCEVRAGGVSLATRKPNQPTYLTPEGWQWLGLRPPTPPLTEKSPETNENAAILQPTQPNQPPEQAGGVGGGGEYDPNRPAADFDDWFDNGGTLETGKDEG